MIKGDQIPLARPEQKLMDVLVELSNKRCGCVLVPDGEGKLIGIFTDGDLRRSLQKEGARAMDASIESLMTKSPKKIGPENLIVEAIKMMEGFQRNEVTVLPVVDSADRIVGLIKIHDIIQAGA